MLSHNQIKYINSLKIKKFRQQHKAFFVEGEKGVAELFQSPLHIAKVFALREWLDANQPILEVRNAEIQEITENELKNSTPLNHNQLLLCNL